MLGGEENQTESMRIMQWIAGAPAILILKKSDC
jgi:hypothetical protein